MLDTDRQEKKSYLEEEGRIWNENGEEKEDLREETEIIECLSESEYFY